jgi:hypothetical protein
VEEARQYPALTAEKRLSLALIGLGLLSPFVGLALQLGFGGHFLVAGLIGFGMSRVAIEMWQGLRPQLTKRRTNRLYSVLSTISCIVLILVSLYYMSTVA